MPTFAIGIGRCLIAESMTTKAASSESRCRTHPVSAERQDGVQNTSCPTPMMTPATVKLPICQAFGIGDGRTLSVVNDIRGVAVIMMDHQQGVRSHARS